MKKFLLGTVALVALGTASAVAADLPARTYTKAPVYAAPIYNWTGIYVGAHIGAAFGGDNGYVTDIPGLVGGSRDAAFLGGGQIGADYQFAPNWLVGVEGQISGLTGNDRNFVAPSGDVLRDRYDWLASVTGRLGYTWGPGLIYAKGGVAFRGDSGLAATAGFLPAVTDRDSTGYTVGGGLEYMFAPAWSAKVEYQYYNFGTTNVATTAQGGTGLSYKDDLHTVKVGVNYHFNWGGPVVAKY